MPSSNLKNCFSRSAGSVTSNSPLPLSFGGVRTRSQSRIAKSRRACFEPVLVEICVDDDKVEFVEDPLQLTVTVLVEFLVMENVLPEVLFVAKKRAMS